MADDAKFKSFLLLVGKVLTKGEKICSLLDYGEMLLITTIKDKKNSFYLQDLLDNKKLIRFSSYRIVHDYIFKRTKKNSASIIKINDLIRRDENLDS